MSPQPMQTLVIAERVRLCSPLEEAPYIELAAETIRQSLPLIESLWGVQPPPQTRVYLHSSWLRALLHGAPLDGKLAVLLGLPFQYIYLNRLWKLAGGWTHRFPMVSLVTVKSPPHLRQSDTSLGQKLFIKIEDEADKFRLTLSHELTHAFSLRLRLPLWLSEGMAMLTSDRLLGVQTVLPETLAFTQRAAQRKPQRFEARVSLRRPEQILEMYARGYWITRYLLEHQPDVLRSVLAKPMNPADLENQLARALGWPRGQFWWHINAAVLRAYPPASPEA